MSDPGGPGTGRTKLDGIRRRRRRVQLARRLGVVVLLLAVGAGAYLFLSGGGLGGKLPPLARPEASDTPDVALAPKESTPAPRSAGSDRAARPSAAGSDPSVSAAPVPGLDLPELDASDPLVRELVGALSSRAELASWLVSEDLVRRFVSAVARVSEGEVPRRQLRALRPRGGFLAGGDEERVTVDPYSYARYDRVADVVASLDTEGAVRLYAQLRPLIDQAWADLGDPRRDFDDALAAAIAELLEAPVVQGEVTLRRGVLAYEYVDPELERLSPAQKQLLRMGPRNAPKVQAKLRELGVALGIPAASLPRATVHRTG